MTFREESVRGVCEKYSSVRPLGMFLLNEYEALLEFSESETVLKIVRMMNKIDMWRINSGLHQLLDVYPRIALLG